MGARIIPVVVENDYMIGAGVPIGSVGSDKDVSLEITFGASWDGYSKRINWVDALGGNATLTLLTPDMIKTGTTNVYIVPVPGPPKSKPGNMMVTVQGYTVDGSEVETIQVTTTAYFKVLPSDWKLDDDESINATLAQQLQASIDNIIAYFTQLKDAEAWAVGTIFGVPVDQSDERYHNNSKYYAEQASDSASSANGSKEAAAVSAGAASDKAEEAKEWAVGLNDQGQYVQQQNAFAYSVIAGAHSNNAAEKSLAAEGYALGKQNGEDVASGSPYYQQNAKYFKEQAAAESAAAASAKSEAQQWATGGDSGSPSSTNNAKHYSEVAEAAAEEALSMDIGISVVDGVLCCTFAEE